ncbi:hypothetical protein GSI_09904 [Ganoderma sinense ZZ0214-1]|uniref:Uncharacterized protein n=1 Tax=Ganoderma sinense ZZ0214-1 TaxID=1077348 RepID=A0A2G8S2F8_9APHY|nr:hypothetical protein GSI_09904 [Ganoderma sinense ZZ0214-1]
MPVVPSSFSLDTVDAHDILEQLSTDECRRLVIGRGTYWDLAIMNPTRVWTPASFPSQLVLILTDDAQENIRNFEALPRPLQAAIWNYAFPPQVKQWYRLSRKIGSPELLPITSLVTLDPLGSPLRAKPALRGILFPIRRMEQDQLTAISPIPTPPSTPADHQ